jgi:hypothetical protein
VLRYYDEYGERESARFEAEPDIPRAPVNLVNLHLHLWHLRRYVRAGDHVLDIGAGPGRFTIELARLGAPSPSATSRLSNSSSTGRRCRRPDVRPASSTSSSRPTAKLALYEGRVFDASATGSLVSSRGA